MTTTETAAPATTTPSPTAPATTAPATTAPATTLHDLLPAWVAALDAVIDELHDDLVRRSIVHLTTLRDELLAVKHLPR